MNDERVPTPKIADLNMVIEQGIQRADWPKCLATCPTCGRYCCLDPKRHGDYHQCFQNECVGEWQQPVPVSPESKQPVSPAPAEKIAPVRGRAEGICDDCGRSYTTPWFVANAIWNEVVGNDRGVVLCVSDFMARAERTGKYPHAWELRQEFAMVAPVEIDAGEFLDAWWKKFRKNRKRSMQWSDIEEVMEEFASHVLASRGKEIAEKAAEKIQDVGNLHMEWSDEAQAEIVAIILSCISEAKG